MSELIFLCGNPRVGKDTVADYLVKYEGYVKLAFADCLYSLVSSKTGIPASALRHDDLKDSRFGFLNPNAAKDLGLSWTQRLKYLAALRFKTPRHHLKAQGKACKKADPEFTCNYIKNLIQTHRRNGQYKIIVTDVRFPWELNCLKGLGGHGFVIRNEQADAKAARLNDQNLAAQWTLKELPKLDFPRVNNPHDPYEIPGRKPAVFILRTISEEMQRRRRLQRSKTSPKNRH